MFVVMFLIFIVAVAFKTVEMWSDYKSASESGKDLNSILALVGIISCIFIFACIGVFIYRGIQIHLHGLN